MLVYRVGRVASLAAALLVCLGAVMLGSCGGGGATTINIIIVPTTITSIDAGSATTLNFTVELGGDTTNAGVTWCLPASTSTAACPGSNTACAGIGNAAGQCGSLLNVTTGSVNYSPPAPTAAQISVTPVAVSVAQKGVNKSVTITVAVPPAFPIPAIVPGGALNGQAYSQTFTITGGVSPYTWSIQPGSVSWSGNNGSASGGNSLLFCLNLNTLSDTTSTTITGRTCTPTGPQNFTMSFTLDLTDAGGSGIVSQAYTITISPPVTLGVATTSLAPGFVNIPYSGTIAPKGGVAPYTFSLVSGTGNLPPNLGLDGSTGQITGTPTAQGTTGFEVMITDSSLIIPSVGSNAIPTNQSASAPLAITIQTPAPLSVVPGTVLGNGTVATAYQSAPLEATGGVPPYTWAMAQGQLPSGLTLSTVSGGNASISGVPILVGASSFTVQVSDSQIPPKVALSSVLNITISAGAANSNSLLKGNYTFLFNGFDKNGPVSIAGTITADGNGNVTGSEDSSRTTASSPFPGVVTGVSLTGTYAIGTDGRGTLQLTGVAPNAAILTTDYDLVLDSSGNAHFFEDNTKANAHPPVEATPDTLGTHGEGILKLNSGSTFGANSLSGNYIFELTGPDTSDSKGQREAIAGVVSANGAGTLGSGASDVNDAGSFTSQPISGNFTFVSGNRGFLALTYAPPNKPQITLTFVFYFVSPSDVFFVEADVPGITFANPPRLSGEMILQNPTTQFGQSILSGTSVATGTGLDGTNASVFAGLLQSTLCDGSTAVSLSYNQNDGGTISQPSFNGTCTVTPNGRVAFQNLGVAPAATRVSSAYLSGPGQGFLLGSDTAVTTGLLEQQTGAPFSDSSIADGYTLSAFFTANNQVTNVLGQVFADGMGDLSGTIDEVDPPASGQELGVTHLDQSFSGSAITTLEADGQGTLTTNAPTGFPSNTALYVVSPSSFRLISLDAGSPLPPEVIFLDH